MSDDDPGESADGSGPDDPDSESDATGEPPEPDDDAPLSELARRMSQQRRDRADEGAEEPIPDIDTEPSDAPPDPDDDPFERMSVGEIDEETLWSSLGADEAPGAGVDADATLDAETGRLGDVDPAPGVESVGGADLEAREHVVPKKKYCQSCPHLEEPPELTCTHEGTEIVEVVDNDRFRVRNCPIVEDGVEPTE